jgi:Zn-finger nucleic acid-binding protein
MPDDAADLLQASRRCCWSAALNCANCGAAMELHASRGYFFCTHCGSFHFPQPSDDQGLRVLGPETDARPCPACRAPLVTAMLDQRPVHVCQACRGVLTPRGVFADVVRARRAWASGPPAAPLPRGGGEPDRAVTCPVCSRTMATHPYLGPGGVTIDTCDTCDVVWLDAGELRRIVDAPGRDRGTRDLPAEGWEPKIEAGAGADFEWRNEGRRDLLSQLLALLR